MAGQSAVWPERALDVRRRKSMNRISSRSDFVEGSAGPLFRVRSCPAGDPPGEAPPGTETILCVAPIGEEMNRSRRFLTALRRACAERGACVELVDPFGTGDSAGEFAEATWNAWVDDLVERARFVVEDDVAGPLTLLGIRSGCLLVDAVARRLDPPPARLVEIQPEHDGAAVVRRFLSARVLAERFGGRKGESVAALEARIAAGENLELGGYEVAASLMRALGAATIDPDAPPPAAGRSHRFDLNESSPAADDAIVPTETDAGWQYHRLPMRPFWQLAESVPDPQVVARIAEALLP